MNSFSNKLFSPVKDCSAENENVNSSAFVHSKAICNSLVYFPEVPTELVNDVTRRNGKQLMVKIFCLQCQHLASTILWNH